MEREFVKVQVKKVGNFSGDLPKYESLWASGMDVTAQIEEDLYIEPGQRVLVPTGLSVSIPFGYEIQVRPRSGWAFREGVTVLNSPGTVDADYRGEIKVILINLSENRVAIRKAERIAQLVLCPVIQFQWEEVTSLDETVRASGGFGSTGKAQALQN